MILSQFDFERSLNLFNAFDVLDGWSNTSVTAEDSLLLISNNSCQRHLLEGLVNLRENTVWVVDIFAQSFGALVTKSKVHVNMFVLVVTSHQHYLLWVLQFKSKEQANNFKTILALINVVTQKQIVVSMDVSSFSWTLPNIEESHQINILSMNISHNLGWRSDFFDDDWLRSKHVGYLIS